MLTLSVAVSFDIGMSVDDTSSFERLTDSEDTGGDSQSTDKVCVLYIKYVRVLCVQVSVNKFDNLIRMVGHHNQ
jgi:hypothetical protein